MQCIPCITNHADRHSHSFCLQCCHNSDFVNPLNMNHAQISARLITCIANRLLFIYSFSKSKDHTTESMYLLELLQKLNEENPSKMYWAYWKLKILNLHIIIIFKLDNFSSAKNLKFSPYVQCTMYTYGDNLNGQNPSFGITEAVYLHD